MTFAFAARFNIASMETQTQTQTHRMGLNPFLTFYIDAMLNTDTNANIKCEHTLSIVFMKNGQKTDKMMLQPILSVFQPVTIDTMLNKNGSFYKRR